MMSQVLSSVNQAITSVRQATATAGSLVRSANDAASTISQAVEAIPSVGDIASAVESVTGTITQATGIVGQAAGAISGLTTSVGTLTKFIGQASSLVNGETVSALISEASNVVGLATNAAGLLSSAIGNVGGIVDYASDIVSALPDVPGMVMDAFSGALDSFDLEGTIFDAAEGAFNSVKSSFESAFGLGDETGDLTQGSDIATVYEGTWDIIDENGYQAFLFTSFLDIDVRNDGKALSYPVEEGGFANYNKVESPLEIRVTLAFQGEEADFGYALEDLDRNKKDAVVMSVITPTKTYENMTLESYSYKRAQDAGAGMLVVEISLVEVRQVNVRVTTTISKPKNPTSASKENTGQKQYASILSGG